MQQAMPDDFRGRAFALFDIAYNLGFIVPAFILVLVWDDSRAGALLVVSGAVFLVLTALVAQMGALDPRRSSRRRTTSRWTRRRCGEGRGSLPGSGLRPVRLPAAPARAPRRRRPGRGAGRRARRLARAARRGRRPAARAPRAGRVVGAGVPRTRDRRGARRIGPLPVDPRARRAPVDRLRPGPVGRPSASRRGPTRRAARRCSRRSGPRTSPLWARTPEAERGRVGLHAERGPESYDLTFRLLAGHDRFHLAQARRALDALSA